MKLRRETIFAAIIVVAAVLTFANSLGGEFVYDDRRQIVQNPLVQENSLIGEALVSDVWAFKGDGKLTASNYWRPVFTGWCILNFRLFGLEPFGWHLFNILLHAGVCLLGFALLRRFDTPALIAGAIMLIFAVHPIHTESVAWISGSPDILFALFFLLALYFADAWASGNRIVNLTLAVVCSLLALGSKEIGVLCAPVFVLLFGKRDDDATLRNSIINTAAWKSASVFLLAAAGFFVARLLVLGRFSSPAENAPDLQSALLTAPSIFLFYIRQIVFPFTMGPNYALRPVTDVEVGNFVLPLVFAVIIIAVLIYIARGSFVRRVGLALFLLPLLPAFLITAFPSDQIVHDRYLYLPLLGFLLTVIHFVAEKLAAFNPKRSQTVIAAASVLIALGLSVKAVDYNRVWLNDLSLWRHAVTVDEKSATNWRQLGAELAVKNDDRGAAEAYDRALSIRPDALALMGRGRAAIALGNTDAAIPYLESVLAMPLENLNAYTLYQTYEAIGVAYQQQQKYDVGLQRLREGRERLPIYRASLTEMIAVMLYVQDRKPEALAELESVRHQARVEMLPSSKSVFFRLGLLYAELGRTQEARSALNEYLASTRNARGEVELSQRRQAGELLKNLR